MRIIKKSVLFIMIIFTSNSFASSDSENPFYVACKEQNVQTDHLTTGFFSNKMPEVDKQKSLTSFSLLSLLINKIEDQMNGTEILLQNIEYCIANPTEENCAELTHWLYIDLPKFVKDARFNAALAQSPNNINSWRKIPEEDINEDLSIWSIHKLNDWDELTSTEAFKARRQLTKYINTIKNKLDQYVVMGKVLPEQYDEFVNKTLLDTRYRHYLKYQSMLGSVHLLQYITAAEPTIEDIYSAFQELVSNFKKEKAYVARKKLEFEVLYNTTMVTSNSILEFMNYRSQLEEVLMENPRYCNLAAAIYKYRGRRYIKQALGVALPVMVGSMFMPPLAGLAVGVGVGGGFAAHSQLRLNDQVEHNMSKVYGDESGIELLEVSDAKKQRDFDIAIMPIGLGLMSSASSKFGKLFARTSVKTSQELTKKSTNYLDLLRFKAIRDKFSRNRIGN